MPHTFRSYLNRESGGKTAAVQKQPAVIRSGISSHKFRSVDGCGGLKRINGTNLVFKLANCG
jgi:hypothetical protein